MASTSPAPTTDVQPSGHRSLLTDSVADFVRRGTGTARARALRDTVGEYDREVWRKMAELGWLGILIPEQYGGLGLGLAEMAIVAEGLARVLAPEPLTAATVLAGGVLVGGDNEVLKGDLLPRVVSGEVLTVLAWQEDAGTLGVTEIKTRAAPFEGGFRMNGEKRFIGGAAGADGFAVSAQTQDGVEVFWVERGAPGVNVDLERLADGRHFGVLRLTDAVVARDRRIASASSACATLEKALDHAAVIAAAELQGVMNRTLELSLDYMKTRVQFGKPIGSFQALQHRAVDLYIQQQLSSAVLEEVVRTLDRNPDARTRAMLASRAKARCSDACLRITREAIQIHGAIGFTDEYDAGLYLKRALVLAAWLGGALHHRRRYAQLTLQADPA